MPRALLLITALAALALVTGCGDPPRVDVEFRYTDARGAVHDGSITCRRAVDSPTCARILNTPALLAGAVPGGAASGQYFGPERIRVTGTIDGRAVDAQFTRADGAAEAAFQRAAGLLLPAIGIVPPPRAPAAL